nr:MAG TPA: hypothetical protein [Caudoviricetes sp.]
MLEAWPTCTFRICCLYCANTGISTLHHLLAAQLLLLLSQNVLSPLIYRDRVIGCRLLTIQRSLYTFICGKRFRSV